MLEELKYSWKNNNNNNKKKKTKKKNNNNNKTNPKHDSSDIVDILGGSL